MDDVKADNKQDPAKWFHDSFYSCTPELDNGEIDEMNLTDKQLRDIGVAVVSRLLALNGRVK
jgi:hypothetical protein